MTQDRFTALETTASEIRQRTSGLLDWAWDDYMRAALATFSRPSEETVRGILTEHFGACHTTESLAGDADAAAVAAACGGLRPGQYLFVSFGAGGAWLIGAWWPWGDGQTISLRLRLLDTSVSPADALEQPLRGWFEI